MSSSAPDLPLSTSSSLILTHPTPSELKRTWTLTHASWGRALSLDDYVKREAYLTTVPLARDGGITAWILTTADGAPDERPVLSSCESLCKPALSSRPGPNDPVDGVAHGIASVFTDPQFRGRGYASRMMRELGARLRTWQAGDGDSKEPLFSVLYSDIGKEFYAKTGWAPFASAHIAFPPRPRGGSNGGVDGEASSGGATPIGLPQLAELCAVDARQLRRTVVARAAETGKTCVALVPSLDAILWHMMREEFMTKHVLGRTPEVRGAVFGKAGERVWALWTRGYYGGLQSMEGNTLHVLRFVFEDENADEEYLVHGLRSIIQVAQAEAADWRSQDVQMWNPTPQTKRLVKQSGLQYEDVDRDNESIASLMWYGEGPTEELDWVCNEKYGWC